MNPGPPGKPRPNTATGSGFDAVGPTRDPPDPVPQAVNCMLDHTPLRDKRLEAMADALERQGIPDHFSRLPDLDAREIDSTADDGESDKDPRSPG